MNEELVKRLIYRTADLAIGPSTVRNQGAAGVVRAARIALRKIDLSRYQRASQSSFPALLQHDTRLTQNRLPAGARHWGTARKCLNIFLRDILYNQFLSDRFQFARFEPVLEVPLDRHVADGLLKEAEGYDLPKWRTIKSLAREDSERFQCVAKKIATRRETHAVHLDLIYWRAVRADK